MIIDSLLAKRQMTKYRLAVDAGIPHATLNDICSGKTRLEKCSAETVAVCSTVFGVNCTEASTSLRSMMPVSHLNTQTISARNFCMEALHHD